MTKTLSNIINYSATVILSKVIGAAMTFCIARLLLPAEYGVWMTLLLIISYSTILCFGTVETLVKQIPYYIGGKKENLIKRIEGGVLASIFLSAGILIVSSLIIFILNFFIKIIPFHQYVQISLVTAAIALFTCFFYYRLTAFSQFKEVSLLNSYRAVITFIFLILLGWKWHLAGMVAGALITEITMLVLSINMNKSLRRPVSLIFDFKLFWDLIKIGFPITMVWWGYIVMTSTDRVITMAMLGKIMTGFYSLGTSIVSILILVPMAIGQVLYPQVNEEVGRKTSNESLSKYVIFPTQVMSLVVPFVLGPLFILTPFIYRYMFPKYLPGIHSAQILLCGAFFVCLVKNGVNYLVALNKQAEVFKYVLASLVANILVTVAAIKLNYGIKGVACGTVIGSFLLTTMIWKSVYKNLDSSSAVQLQKLAQLYSPMIIMTIILLAINVNVRSIHFNLIITISLSLFLFLVIYSFAIFSTPFLRTWAVLLIQKVQKKAS